MVRSFYLLVSLLLFSLVVISTHALLYDSKGDELQLLAIANLSKITAPSLSVAFYEPRVLAIDQGDNPAYPGMQNIDRMDFVYAQ